MDKKILIVAKREYLERVRTRWFVAMTLLYVLFVKIVPIISIWELKAGEHQPPSAPPLAEEQRLREQHS